RLLTLAELSLDEGVPSEGPPPQNTLADPEEQSAEATPSFLKLKARIPLPFAPEVDPNEELRQKFAEGTLDDKLLVAAVLIVRNVATQEERALYDAHRPRAPIRPQAP